MRKINWSNAVSAVILAMAVALSGCSVFKKDKKKDDETAEELYAIAQENMNDKNWITAVEALRKLEARYPYGNYAEQAQLDTIYAYYKNKEPGLAIAAADRFIKLHPTHRSVDYAYYLKGMASYEEDKSFFGRITGQDDLSDRDASLARRAMKAFEDVYVLFPDSQYAPDARARAKYLLNSLAKHEIAVANYYYSRGAFVAVVNRAKGIVENYPSTPSIENALALLMFSYENMGLQELADDSRRVLALNYPGSEFLDQTADRVKFSNWYSAEAKKKEKKGGWFSSLFNRFRKKPES